MLGHTITLFLVSARAPAEFLRCRKSSKLKLSVKTFSSRSIQTQIHIAWRRHPRVHRQSLRLLRTTWIAVWAAAVLQFGNDMTLNSLLLVCSDVHNLITHISSNSEPLEQLHPCNPESFDQSQAFLSGALVTCYLASHPRGRALPFVSGAGVVSSVVVWTACCALLSVLAKKVMGLILWLVGAGGGNESSHIYDVIMTKLGYSRLGRRNVH